MFDKVFARVANDITLVAGIRAAPAKQTVTAVNHIPSSPLGRCGAFPNGKRHHLKALALRVLLDDAMGQPTETRKTAPIAVGLVTFAKNTGRALARILVR